MPVSQEALEQIALTRLEYEQIVERLGREPNPVELGLFGALWSEHCGYKHSRPLLRLLPSDSPRLMVAPGAENAGVVDIGDGLAVVLKIESHNHPSAVEPFQGAATGVGGIVRDILTMGARPIALLNSLRFGPLTEDRQRHLFRGVVGGISWYGNCIGVPDVGGEIAFNSAYAGNPLVNAMCVGVLPQERLMRARASGAGNLLVLVGADTGRDGIHGASGLASRSFHESAGEGGKHESPVASPEGGLRSAVQVGNPFLEKVLIEACLEVLDRHPEAVVAVQDLGAAGLTSATVECAERGGVGVVVDVTKVPRREHGMSPYEVMLSESQERMLLVLRPKHLERVQAVLEKWDLVSAVIGRVTEDGLVRILDGEAQVAEVPVQLLTDPPLYRLQGVKPPELQEAQNADLAAIPLPSSSPGEVLLRLLASPNVASREIVYRQYDHQVGINTVVAPGRGDAAVLRLRGTHRGITLTVDGNGRYCSLDPFMGGAIAVAEACRNLACVGAEPTAITDCLNFGDPERPEVYYQMEECIKGMAAACQALGVPVVSGNVSLYNETADRGVYPTPVIGALGLLEETALHCVAGFQREGDLVLLLGASQLDDDPASLAGSEYLECIHSQVLGQPTLDLDQEVRLQRLCRQAIAAGLLSSAHDCAEGGLGVALAESCILGDIGLVGGLTPTGRWDVALFGESQSRIVVSLSPDRLPDLERMATEEGVSFVAMGRVDGHRFLIPNLLDLSLDELKEAWHGGLEKALTVS